MTHSGIRKEKEIISGTEMVMPSRDKSCHKNGMTGNSCDIRGQ